MISELCILCSKFLIKKSVKQYCQSWARHLRGFSFFGTTLHVERIMVSMGGSTISIRITTFTGTATSLHLESKKNKRF